MDGNDAAEAASSDPDISSDDDKTQANTPRVRAGPAVTASTPQSDCTEVWNELEVELLSPSDYTPRDDPDPEASDGHEVTHAAGQVTVPKFDFVDRSGVSAEQRLHHVVEGDVDTVCTPAQGNAAVEQGVHRPSPLDLVTPATIASTVATPCFSEFSDVVDLTQT